MRVMITGGGTGGHTSPAVAIIEDLRKRDPRLMVQWVGCSGGIEERVAERIEVPFRSVLAEGWPRTMSLGRLRVGAKLAIGVAQAILRITRFRPQVVIGVGGYVSLPLGYAAQRMGVPTVLHEQNKRLGMANRLLAPRAARIFLSYPDTLGDYPRDRASVVGNPVRAGFARPPDRAPARDALGLDASTPVVLICGGSQGARTLNEATREAIAQFKSGEVQILWMTGNADAATARAAAEAAPIAAQVFSFIDDMVTACAAADLIVGRAGASSTAEIAMMGKPSILVPYPHATDNHQEANARAFDEAGAAVLLLDDACTGATLVRLLRDLLGDDERLAAMGQAARSLARPGAAEAIGEEVLTLAFERTP